MDGNGHVLSKRNFFEGGGFVIQDTLWDTSNRERKKNFPPEYWIPDLPDSYIRAWETVNPKGKVYYKDVAVPYYKNYK